MGSGVTSRHTLQALFTGPAAYGLQMALPAFLHAGLSPYSDCLQSGFVCGVPYKNTAEEYSIQVEQVFRLPGQLDSP